VTSAAVEAVAARSGQDARSAAGSAGEGVEALTHTRGGAVRLVDPLEVVSSPREVHLVERHLGEVVNVQAAARRGGRDQDAGVDEGL
jgi:hypothetical protein